MEYIRNLGGKGGEIVFLFPTHVCHSERCHFIMVLGSSRNQGAKPILSRKILRLSGQAPDQHIHFQEIGVRFIVGVLGPAISYGDDSADDFDLVIPFGRDLEVAIVRIIIGNSFG